MMDEIIEGYCCQGEWKTAANGDYIFAHKDGREFFLKRFQEPKYPEEGLSADFRDKKIKRCEQFSQERRKIIVALQQVSQGNGNILTPQEFFLNKPYYYQASLKSTQQEATISQIVKLPEEKRMLLIKTLCMDLMKIHSVKIVHGDLKPENILISRSQNGELICKLIDFDDSYFSQKPPLPADTMGTEEYWSPELAEYKVTEDTSLASNITCQSDIFALGLILHEYCTGKMPDTPGGGNAYEYVYEGGILTADKSIKSEKLQSLINSMLLYDPDKRPTSKQIVEQLTGMKKNYYIVDVESTQGGLALVNGKPFLKVTQEDALKFSAEPSKGYRFAYWEYNGIRKEDPVIQIRAVEDLSVKAFFEKIAEEEANDFASLIPLEDDKIKVVFLDNTTRVIDKSTAKYSDGFKEESKCGIGHAMNAIMKIHA